MAGSFQKGAIPPDLRVVIPEIEDANGRDPAGPPVSGASATSNIGRALGLIAEDWIAKNGASIDGQSLQQPIADGKNVQG